MTQRLLLQIEKSDLKDLILQCNSNYLSSFPYPHWMLRRLKEEIFLFCPRSAVVPKNGLYLEQFCHANDWR